MAYEINNSTICQKEKSNPEKSGSVFFSDSKPDFIYRMFRLSCFMGIKICILSVWRIWNRSSAFCGTGKFCKGISRWNLLGKLITYVYLWIWKIADHSSAGLFSGFFVKYPSKRSRSRSKHHFSSNDYEFCSYGACVKSINI